MENLDVSVPSSRSSDRPRRNTFISPELEVPQLIKQISDIKLSKKGTNVYVRFRPDNYKEEQEGKQVVDYFPDLKTIAVDNHSFKFKRIFPGETTQEQIFLSVGVPLIDPILDGYNCGIMAYGQTGAGKTFSLLGHGYDQPDRVGRGNPEKRGLVPRLLQSLFHEIQVSITPSVTFTVYASFIQIYLEKIYDLLNPAKETLKIYQDTSKGLWVTDATNVPVKNSNEILKQIELGIVNRITAATNSNSESSRAHAILVMTINKNLINQGTVISSQVYCVDLCGSERTSKTGAVEERLKEAQNINKSLLSLGNVIGALVENKKHIPYRDSKLTRLLQNCFGGTSIATLVLCCSANSVSSTETLATLRFGDRANKVKNKPVRNMGDSVTELRRLLNEANSKIYTQQRIVRSQIEKIIELETITKELFSICGDKKLGALRARYQIKFNPKKKNGFEMIGYYPFISIFTFISPMECLEMIHVCKLFDKRLKTDLLWRSYIDLAKKGKAMIFEINIETLSNVNDNIYQFVREIHQMRTNESLSVRHGMTLFVNRRS
ncbi:hypothetical protein SteCoe_4422 [Stentor coeruleus]|uniref:Kinesin motor domain-containing protein n=1 Tax=Stentor coeruleus TaxID=5963 RepID=A0A1R2CUT8_9CILI|nr:hypothetical protein SteCoe_4422 [Stentor coeruleus]